MITLEELDEAKQKVDEAFDKYDRIGDKTTTKDFCLKQEQYSSMFDEYWSCKSSIEVKNGINMMDDTKWTIISRGECCVECLLCGHKSHAYNNGGLHYIVNYRKAIKILIYVATCAMKKHLSKKHKLRNLPEIVKPWEDRESLFCSSDFLTKPVCEGGMGIDIRKGDECGDNK